MTSTAEKITALNANVDRALSNILNRPSGPTFQLLEPDAKIYQGDVSHVFLPTYEPQTHGLPTVDIGTVDIIETTSQNDTPIYVLQFTSPTGTYGEATITVGGRTLTFNVNPWLVEKPSATSLEDGAVSVTIGTIITASAPIQTGIDTFTHTHTHWQFSRSDNFETIEHDVAVPVSNNQGNYAVDGALEAGVVYYMRHRFEDQTNDPDIEYSRWSDVTGFKTYLLGINGDELAMLSSVNLNNYAELGGSVDISADGMWIISGAMNHNEPNTGAAAAIVWRKLDGVWLEFDKLVPSAWTGNDYFGKSVAISGDGEWVVVGAPSHESDGNYNSGAAFLYRRIGDAYVEQAKFNPDVILEDSAFGEVVCISDDGAVIAVSATAETWDGKNSAGAFYIFDNSAGVITQTARFTNSTATWGNNFGSGLSISGDGAVISASAFSSGDLYTYRNNSGWALDTTVITGAADDSAFAPTLNYDGSVLAFGTLSTSHLPEYNGIGKVDLYTLAPGVATHEASIYPTGSGLDNWLSFGASLSLSANGDVLAVGTNREVVYAFIKSAGTWQQQVELTPMQPSTYDYSANIEVATSGDGNTILVADAGYTEVGTVFVYG